MASPKSLLLPVVLAAAALALLAALSCYWMGFSANLSNDLSVRQGSVSGTYSLVDRASKRTLVEHVDGWYFERNFVVGSSGPHQYYAFDRGCRTLRTFTEIWPLLTYLRGQGVVGYEYKREQGVEDLRLGEPVKIGAEARPKDECVSASEESR